MQVKDLKEILKNISNKNQEVCMRQTDYMIVNVGNVVPLCSIIQGSKDAASCTVAELYLMLLEHADEAEIMLRQTDNSIVFLADVVPAFSEESFVCLIGSKTPSSYLHHYL